jgi:ankyrin repeat protein
MYAIQCEDIALVKRLIAAGADVNAKSRDGKTALKLATGHAPSDYQSWKANPAIVALLKQAGAKE